MFCILSAVLTLSFLLVLFDSTAQYPHAYLPPHAGAADADNGLLNDRSEPYPKSPPALKPLCWDVAFTKLEVHLAAFLPVKSQPK